LIAAAAGNSPLALAQDGGWYLGAGAGQSNARDSCPSQIPVGVSCDDTSTAYSVFGGYMFNRYIGAELGYAYLGETSAFASGITETIKVQGLELLAVGAIPINPHFEIYGKVGVFFWDLKDSCTGISCTYGSQNETGSDLTYALGAQFNFSRNYGMRLQYQRYQDVGEEATTGKSDIDVLSISILFKF
jgi:OOP family OmpA-OmpF porin